ncbi:MAG: molybdenum cofactor guanylyltransferase [Caldilineae bacterium]|nr:MAG: molybdenum cofactor guanylyltransferase [Caldilineae bacterium]
MPYTSGVFLFFGIRTMTSPSSSPTKIPLTALILAGGASSRMGTNKALLELDGIPLIERVLAVVTTLTPDILIVTNDPGPYRYLNLPTVADREPGQGPLMGLYSGLLAAHGELALLVACDMPFLQRSVLEYLLTGAEGFDVIMPYSEDGLHPLCAVYRRRTCLPAIAHALAERKRKMIAFLDEVRVRRVGLSELRPLDPDGLSLMNVNTPEDLALAREILHKSKVNPQRPED